MWNSRNLDQGWWRGADSRVEGFSKLYASLLNQRLLGWCERMRKFGEEQGGFRPDRATMDHVLF